MRLRALMLLMCATLVNCGYGASSKGVAVVSATPTATVEGEPQKTPKVSQEEAVRIAKEDAVREDVALEDYEIATTETPAEWNVMFTLKNKRLNGGGPKYLIDKETGKIKSRKYTQ